MNLINQVKFLLLFIVYLYLFSFCSDSPQTQDSDEQFDEITYLLTSEEKIPSRQEPSSLFSASLEFVKFYRKLNASAKCVPHAIQSVLNSSNPKIHDAAYMIFATPLRS